MKTLILTTAIALSLGAATLPASAQGIVIGTPGYSDRGDRGECRMIEKRVVKNNKTVITKERRCDSDRRSDRRDYDRRDNDRYVDRRDNRPGVYIGR